MKKLVFIFLFLLGTTHFISAQKTDLVIKNDEKGAYLEHKVVAKENFYSIGRLFNVSPKFIASFNKLDMNKGLFIDQKIRIPLTDTNFTQKGNSGTPVYYKVGDKENLSKVSGKNKNVSLSDLRSWNNLSGDNVKEGTRLIIGFLVTKEMPSVTIAPVKQPVIMTEEKPVSIDAAAEEKALKKEGKEEEKATQKEEKKETGPIIKKEEIGAVPTGEGYFKFHFEQQVKKTPASKNETMTSGIFKTISGWQDAKYYLLIDAVQPGMIVKVVNPSNNKVIYAKVLGEMSGIRQNEGLNIRISNAAASALQIAEQDKFILKVNY